jgi:hypothetical protein
MGFKSIWDRLRRKVHRAAADSSEELDPGMLKGMVEGILATHLDEIGCDECFEVVDQFVEMELAGKDAAEAMPLVQDHLHRCKCCREEFEALLAALRAMT